MNRTLTISAATLALLAGVPATLSAAEQPRNTQEAQAPHSTATNPIFVSTDGLMGSVVKNSNGTALADITDLVLERGSGHVEYIILSSGGFLGLGDTQVGVPYGAFEFNTANDRFTLDATAEQMELAAVADRRSWLTLESDSWRQELSDAREEWVQQTSRWYRDPYAESVKTADEAEISGRILEVDRSSTATGVEQVRVMVRDDSGTTRNVILGPTWFVMSQDAAPRRGDEIKVVGYKLKGDRKDRIVAREMHSGPVSTVLRDDSGTPRWDITADLDYETTRFRSPLVLASDIIGRPVTASGDDAGEIISAIIEVGSGRVTMLACDPDDNFLGLGDTVRCVPWNATSVVKDRISVDADRSMLLASVALPDDLDVFTRDTRRNAVYNAFGIDPIDIEPRAHADRISRGVWSSDGELVRAFNDAKSMKLGGTVVSIDAERLFGNDAEMTCISVKTDNGSTKKIVLGPSWHFDARTTELEEGDRVSLDVKRVKHAGESMYMASTLTHGGSQMTLWRNGTPAWASE